MKTKIISIVVMLMMACNVMAQDYMMVYFKDRSCRKFYLNDITSIATKKLDADGIQHSDYEYQHITTLHNKYVYNLNEVDSITFSKFKEEEVINNMSVTLPEIFEVISSCSNVNDINNYLSKIKNYQGVEDAWVSGVELFVTFKGWETMSFTFPHNSDSEEDEEDLARESNRAKAMIPRMEAIVKPEGKELKAVIANQQAFDESRQKNIIGYYVPLQLQFESCGIKTDNKTRPRLSFFAKDIFNYDLIFLVTHGTYDFKIHSHELLTGDELCVIPKKGKGDELAKIEKDKELLDSLFAKRKPYEATDEHIRTGWIPEVRDGDSCWVCYVSITEKFIEEKADGHFENSHSIMFNTACKSLAYNNSLAYIYLEKGLGVYLGYTNINTVGKKAGPKMYEFLLSGVGLFEAVRKRLPENYRKENGNDGSRSYLQFVYNPSIHFDRIFLFPTVTKPLEQDELEKQLGNRIVELKGITTSIQPNAISYGFYIYDGFKGKRYRIEATVVEHLSEGKVLFKVDIPNFIIDYDYEYSAYTFDGSDYNSEDTLNIHIPIIVCPDNNHPHAIDLGLPSGTKWACCNVGASKPEVVGGYFAWGEKVEKPRYTPVSYKYSSGLDEDGDGWYDDWHDDTMLNGVWPVFCSDIAGTEYDVAAEKMEGSWRMPTAEQVAELRYNYITWNDAVELNNVPGYTITGPNGASIFFPFSGKKNNDELIYEYDAFFWSSSRYSDRNVAYSLHLDTHSVNYTTAGIYEGLPVRPVCK